VEQEDTGRRPNPRTYIAVGVAIVILTIVMASTGPEPEAEMTGSIPRLGGVCLQLERWGLFGWDIIGQTYTTADQESASWRNPPRANPACEIVPEDEYLITLPANSPTDVYRVCGLADERPCLEFTLLES
jgi:hypothetical protein